MVRATILNDSSHGPKPSRRGKRATVVADFETTTNAEDCRVWGWGLAFIESPDDVIIDQDIAQFIDFISGMDSTCYFHNLKFDGRFILDWLLNNRYQLDTSGDFDLVRGSFKCLISDMGRFYSLTVKWWNGNTTEFRDSLNKIPLPVARIATAFKLGEVKGDIDYHTYRPVGHILTDEERDYIRRDVSIVAKAMVQTLEAGMLKLTVASDSLAHYKELMGKRFDKLFPILSHEMDAEIRRAYRGGFTYADPRFKGCLTRSGIVLDVNSLYPAVMKNELIPYGEPQYQDGKVTPDDSFPLTIFSITFTASLKPNHIPCIQIKGSSIFAATEYLTDILEPTTLMMTNVDFELYSDHYDMDILEWGGGWRFRAKRGLFDEYINKWAKIKEESVGGMREIAKLHLNSLYGKFATNPNVSSKIPVLRDGVVRLVRGADDQRDPVYTAAGVFITSHARNLTIRAAQDNYDVFAYADTDSLHLIKDSAHLVGRDPKTVTAEELGIGLDVHPTRMGAWKFEYAFDKAFYIRPKAYLERHADGSYTNRIAGLPERISANLTFGDVVDGNIIEGKLTPIAVPGGIVLTDTPYMLKL